VMAVVVVVGVVAALLVEPAGGGLALALVCAPPAAMGGVAGAAASLVAVPDPLEALLMPPEVTGAFQAFRIARPLLLALAGTLPVLAARAAAHQGDSAIAGAGAAAAGVAVGFLLILAWLWKREKLQAAMQASVSRPGGARP
jgi:hypothetical protein